MTLSELARDTIVALELIPAENIGINAVLDADWDGIPKILIIESETRPEDETQFGVLSWVTTLTIACAAMNRQDASEIGQQAADAIFEKFSELENRNQSGDCDITKIFSMTLKSVSLRNIPDRTEFESLHLFEILHR